MKKNHLIYVVPPYKIKKKNNFNRVISLPRSLLLGSKEDNPAMDAPMVSLDKCDFSRLTSSPCGKSDHYTIDKLLFNIFECSKEAITHLQTVKCTERTFSSSSTHGSFPESLLILYRSGIFSIDNGSLSLNICQKHRDEFGIYWKCNKVRCCHPDHPTSSKAKADRGAPPSLCKEYWLKTRQLIQVGTGKHQLII